MASIGNIGKLDGNDLSKMVVGGASPMRTGEVSEQAASQRPAITQISTTGRLQNSVSQLAEATRKLSQASTWQATKATSNNTDVLDATSQSTEVSQDIKVDVEQVATAQTAVATFTPPLATPIGLGTLNLEMGQWDSSYSAFTPNPNWPKARMSVGPGDASVERLRDKINAAGMGVVANVISDSTGTYLILRASAGGANNGFKVSAEVSPEATEAQARAMKAMEFDPAKATGGMQLTQAAQDAVLKVNGQTVTSGSNFVEDVVPGVDVTVKKPSTETIKIALNPNRDSAKAMVEDFVHSYNDLASQTDSSTDSNAADPRVATAAQSARQAVQDIWAKPDKAGLRQSLEDLGLKLDKGNRLQLDAKQLDQGLQQSAPAPEQLAQLSQAMASALKLASASTPSEASQERASPPAAADASSAARTRPNASTPNTSALFRQAVLEQYTSNMYAEDTN